MAPLLKPLHVAQQSVATLLFGLRILPLLASVVITIAFVMPSFQRLEPRSGGEGMGAMPLALGLCALLLIAYACFSVIAAEIKSTRVVTRWLQGARIPASQCRLAPSLYNLDREAPPLTLVGVRSPKILVSEATLTLLSHDELQIALKHELQHMKSRDNLKKLIFRCCPFPGMAKLEGAWSQAAELAADDAAVSNPSDAVDLAAALVKLSRLVPVEAAPLCAVGFVTDSLSAACREPSCLG